MLKLEVETQKDVVDNALGNVHRLTEIVLFPCHLAPFHPRHRTNIQVGESCVEQAERNVVQKYALCAPRAPSGDNT